jgi:hypothetical protein
MKKIAAPRSLAVVKMSIVGWSTVDWARRSQAR